MAQLKPGSEGAIELRRDLGTTVTNYVTGKGTLASLINEIERVAKYCRRSAFRVATLGDEKTRRCVEDLVRCGAPFMLEETGLPGWTFRELYRKVYKSRNDLMHTGTAAVLTGTRTVALALVLMEALLSRNERERPTADQLMVSNPVCARSWQTLADVRRTMLMYDYTTLPLEDGGCQNGSGWYVLQAGDLARYFLKDPSRVKETVRESTALPRQCVLAVDTDTAISDVAAKVPVVVAKKGRLVGIITAFDLL